MYKQYWRKIHGIIVKNLRNSKIIENKTVPEIEQDNEAEALNVE